MALVKKLIFAPLFLITLTFLFYQINPLFKSYDFIFTFSLSTIIQLATVAGLISTTSLLFVISTSFAYNWKLVLPVAILASILPLFFVSQSLGLILTVGILAVFLLTYLALENTLKTYLDFKPGSLFGPHIKSLSTFLILVVSLTYFLSISLTIQKGGFQIPDSLIDQALKLAQPQTSSQKEQISIPPEQLGLLEQAVKEQLEGIIKPYLGIIPGVLAVLFFFVLQSLVSLLNLLIHPMLWIIFYILEKTGYIKFTEEQRTVKKMVV